MLFGKQHHRTEPFPFAAAINEMRRKLLDDLTEKRKELPIRRSGTFPPTPSHKAKDRPPELIFQVLSADQLTPELAELKASHLYVPLEVLADNFKKALPFSVAGTNIVAVMPRVISSGDMHQVRDTLYKVRDLGVGEVLLGNLGHIKPAVIAGLKIRGDFGLNIFNSYAMETLSNANFISATASFELRLSQIRDMMKPIDTEIIVYGRLPAMVTEQCVIKKSAGRCSCQNPSQLFDQRGSVFPVVREFGCRNVIYNTHKLYLADKRREYESAGLWAVRLMFTTESAFECVQVAKNYLGLKEYRPNGLTRGLYFRGVE
jgi:putative protease